MNKNRVIAIIRGGIGNQLFTYAAAKNIALRNGAKLILATDWFENEPHGRHFLLDQFSITADLTSLGNSDVPYSPAHHSRAKKLGRYFYAASKTYPHYFVERTKNFLNHRVPIDRRAFAIKNGDYLFVDGFSRMKLIFVKSATS